MPGANAALTSKAIGLSRETKTNEAGFYLFSDVLPGSYNLAITAPGFRTFARPGVPVTINTVSRVDVELEVGAVTETIEVLGQATPLQTDKTDVHVEIGKKEISDLPLPAYRNERANPQLHDQNRIDLRHTLIS